MSCPEFRDQLPLLIYGDLPAYETAQVEQHLSECERCRNEVAALRQVREVLDATPAPEVMINPSQIFLSVADRPVHKQWFRWAITGGLAISLLLLAILNLELRIDRQQFVIRWGRPTERHVDQASWNSDALAALNERVRTLQELTHALARDVDIRDQARLDDLNGTKSRLDALTRLTGQQLVDARRDVDALYAAHFKTKTTE